MTPLVGNQGIIVNPRYFYSRRCNIFDIFVEQILCYRRYISVTHNINCELLITDVANTLLKRSVGSRWWLVHQNGHYHHGTGLGEDAEYK